MNLILNYVDIGLIIIIALSIIFGLVRGFTREFFGVLGWSSATFVTFWAKYYTQDIMRLWIKNQLIADFITISILFVLSLFIFLTLSRVLSKKVKASVLGGLDRSLGVFFGTARGIFICIMMFIVSNTIWSPEKRPAEISQSYSFPYLLQATEFFAHLLPKGTIPMSFFHLNPANATALMALSQPRSADDLMRILAKPKTLSTEKKEETEYKTHNRQDMDRLFKNYSE